VLSHFRSCLVGRPPSQELKDLPWQAREDNIAFEANSADDLELPDFDIQVVHARFAGIGFDLLDDGQSPVR
jgi:hypothetical protein